MATLDSVDLYMGLSFVRSGWDVVVSVYAFANYTVPPDTGSLLGSKAIDVSNVPLTGDGDWVNFTFDTPIDISTDAGWIGIHVTTTAPNEFARASLKWYESSEFEFPSDPPYTGTEAYWRRHFTGSWVGLTAESHAYKLNTTDCDSNNALTPNASYRDFSVHSQQGIRSYLYTYEDVVVIRSVKLGANGAFIVVAAKDGVYLSTDSGANWSRKTPDAVEDTDWEKGICSRTGTYIIVVSDADAIYRTPNSGSSWAQITPAGGDTFSVNKMATSDDGQFMVIVGQNSTDATESCYISTDYGVTWTAKKPVVASIEYTECDISNDGTVIAVSTSTYFYISLDSGVTWKEQGMAASAEVWKGLSISGDGTTGLVANTNDNDEFFIGINTELYSKATWAESTITSAGRALIDDATVADQNTTLGFGTGDSPTLAGLTLSGLTDTRLVQSGSALNSVADLTTWIAGTANQIIVTDDEDGTVTLSGPQDIHTGASPTFAGITILGTTPILIFRDSDGAGSASVGFIEWRDSGGGRAGFFGNSSSGNDDLVWKNEQGGNIVIQTTSTGNIVLSPGGNTIINNGILTVGTGTSTEWDAAFDNMVTDIAFNTGDGIITITQQDSGTLTTDSLDGRYYTETELGSVSNGVGASLIGVEDAMLLYAATDVEAALAEVMDMITIVTHVADSFEVGGDQVGTVTGIVENTQVINDGDELILNETTGGPNPNFVQTFEFNGITAGHEPNLIELHWYYSPITTPHTLSIQMYNYNTSTWDVIDNITLVATGGTLTFSTFAIIDGGSTIVDYTSGGAARVRFSHDDNGISSHDFGIDYLAIKDDHGIGSGITDHGSMSGLQDDDHDPLYHTDGRAATWLAANHETTFIHADIATNTTHSGTAHDYAYISGNDGATDVTGTELESLTDNSIVNALHRHSELVASDGSVDPAVNVNAAGRVGFGTTSQIAVIHAFHATNNLMGIFESGNTAVTIRLKDSAKFAEITSVAGNLQFSVNDSTTIAISTNTAGSTTFNSVTQYGQIILANGLVNETTQRVSVQTRHYEVAERNVFLFGSFGNGTVNRVFFGGGSTNFNAATSVEFWTASNNISNGVLQVTVDSTGGVFMFNLKSGTTQGNAGAATDELWVDIDADNTVKMGV